MNPAEFQARSEVFRQKFNEVLAEVKKAIVGHEDLTMDCLVAIFSQGHVLLEGVPGLGKTHMVKVLSRVLGLSFGRVQCTPDLMPADILGTHIVAEDETGRRVLRFEKGPVFRHLLLVDEINRATPKTQSALLEVMQEQTVSAGSETHVMPKPFFVLATQNPLEMEGTYPLPEAQLDRFFYKLKVPFPSMEELVEISQRTTGSTPAELSVVLSGDELLSCQQLLPHVPIAEPLVTYAATLILGTHPKTPQAPSTVNRYVSYGASPRGLQTLVRGAKVHCLLEGRTTVSISDIRRVALSALRHRIILNFEGEAESVDTDRVINELLEKTPDVANAKAA
ncbi:AAA family ATPase [Verrucomicrobia bacterium LW23]|nr:AAA family ATPase [Verrucomicrobia bacterium LW23]